MSKNGGRRNYTKEFKREAVSLTTEGGRNLAEVARNLGVHENVLYRWRREYMKDTEVSFPGKGNLKPEDEEYRRLQKELYDVKMERDILRKALAIFSQHQK